MTTSFANGTMVKAYWHIAEDYPPNDGEYVVTIENSEGITYLDVWEFTALEGWLPLAIPAPTGYPKQWCDLPVPQ